MRDPLGQEMDETKRRALTGYGCFFAIAESVNTSIKLADVDPAFHNETVENYAGRVPL